MLPYPGQLIGVPEQLAQQWPAFAGCGWRVCACSSNMRTLPMRGSVHGNAGAAGLRAHIAAFSPGTHRKCSQSNGVAHHGGQVRQKQSVRLLWSRKRARLQS